ncbi:glycoside hydrolase N-terminal domain-containing protein [Streptomyces sp. NPDC002463]|uniref:glycosyl hydrolase family 95 catalytic domain-containing protein n=1 Tax=Streptomyces sp. NPDC002463 TaxID=3364645 RepID=UPI0036945A73
MPKDRRPPADRLWYRTPATRFLEALPLGNGRLGALLYGAGEQGRPGETVHLNADTLWSGGPGPRDRVGAADHLSSLRAAVLADRDHGAAEALAERMQGPYSQAYQPLATLHLTCGDDGPAEDYIRALDLDTAVHRVSYRTGGAEMLRESFVSAPAGVFVTRVTASGGGRVDLTARLHTPHPDARHAGDGTGAVVSGRVPAHLSFGEDDPVRYAAGEGMGFAAGLRVIATGGCTAWADGTVRVDGADEVLLLVAAGTGYRGPTTPSTGPDDGPVAEVRRLLDAAAGLPYEKLLAAHVADHQRLYRRAALHLGTKVSELPTDERLVAGQDDPGLAALLFAYGRYLLIASSRPGTQPANLQGIWNTEVAPPWNANWTTNINLQMNYWHAETTGLAECHEPLLDLIADLAEPGAHTAATYYGARGWTVHHNLDLWRGTHPVSGSPSWANWPMAGAWLCAHLWERHLFDGDRAFLAERAYPLMRGAAEFLLDLLTEDGEGALVTCPSTSPEHHFRLPGGGLAAVSAGATMDHWLAAELLGRTAEAARLLAVDHDFADTLDAVRARLRPPRTDDEGRLLEWWEDLPEEDPGHRHLSHLYGLYPGDAVDPLTAPALVEPARRALARRLEHGSGSTGWSRAWVAALAARLGDAELAHESVRTLLAEYTAPNLFGLHPPDLFQIDGNFGIAAAIGEMLLQSHNGVLRLLPALPEAWPTGSVTGLRARGGTGVDLHWAGGVLTEAVLDATRSGTLTIRLPAGTPPHLTVTEAGGAPAEADIDLGRTGSGPRLRVEARAGTAYRLSVTR